MDRRPRLQGGVDGLVRRLSRRKSGDYWECAPVGGRRWASTSVVKDGRALAAPRTTRSRNTSTPRGTPRSCDLRNLGGDRARVAAADALIHRRRGRCMHALVSGWGLEGDEAMIGTKGARDDRAGGAEVKSIRGTPGSPSGCRPTATGLPGCVRIDERPSTTYAYSFWRKGTDEAVNKARSK